MRCLVRAIVKGNTTPLQIYEVLDAEIEAIRDLKLQTLSIFEQEINRYSQGDLADAKFYLSQILKSHVEQ